MNRTYEIVVKEWLEFGGALWSRFNFVEYKMEYFTTNDDEEIKEMYSDYCYSMKNIGEKPLPLEDAIKSWARDAMEHAGEAEEKITEYLNY